MKTQIHSKILAIATAAMIGLATTGGAALARGGGGFGGGHIGGFGGAHMGVVGGSHVGSVGVGHMGGLGVHPMGTTTSSGICRRAPAPRWIAASMTTDSATLISRMNWDTTIFAVSTVCRHCTTTTIAPGRLT